MAKRKYSIGDDKLLNRKCDPSRSYQCRRTCLRNSQKCDVKQSQLSQRKLNEATSVIRNSLGLSPRVNNVDDVKTRYASLLNTPISFTTGNELSASSRGQFSLMEFLKPNPTNVTGLADLIDLPALAAKIKQSGASGQDRTSIYLPPVIAAELEKSGITSSLQNSGIDLQGRTENTRAQIKENSLENRITGADTELTRQQAVADMKREQDKSSMFTENTPGQLDCNQGNYACGGKCQRNSMKCPSKNFPQGVNKALSNGVASITKPVPTPDLSTVKAEQERFKRKQALMERGKAERDKKAQEQFAKNPPAPPDMSAAIAEKKRREQKKKDSDSARVRLGGSKEALELAQQEQRRRQFDKSQQTGKAARDRLGGDSSQVIRDNEKAREAAKTERARRVGSDDLSKNIVKQKEIPSEAKDAALQERARRNMNKADKAMQDIDKADPDNQLVARVQERMRNVDKILKDIPEDVKPQIDDLLSNTDLTPDQQKEEAEKIAENVAKSDKKVDPQQLAGFLLALLAIGSISALAGGGLTG